MDDERNIVHENHSRCCLIDLVLYCISCHVGASNAYRSVETTFYEPNPCKSIPICLFLLIIEPSNIKVLVLRKCRLSGVEGPRRIPVDVVNAIHFVPHLYSTLYVAARKHYFRQFKQVEMASPAREGLRSLYASKTRAVSGHASVRYWLDIPFAKKCQ